MQKQWTKLPDQWMQKQWKKNYQIMKLCTECEWNHIGAIPVCAVNGLWYNTLISMDAKAMDKITRSVDAKAMEKKLPDHEAVHGV